MYNMLSDLMEKCVKLHKNTIKSRTSFFLGADGFTVVESQVTRGKDIPGREKYKPSETNRDWPVNGK